MIKGIIFNIQRFSISDGPGIRTNIFLKGCPMACRWCSNPEGQKMRPEPGRYPDRCLGPEVCGRCRNADGSMRSWEDQAAGCPSGAIKIWGEEISDEALMEVILKDRDYYERSGGGVTLIGGEPLMQPEFVSSVLKSCRKEGIHTCVETALHVPESSLDMVIGDTDLMIADLKMMDTAEHRKWTGVGNELILRNLASAAKKTELMLRIPMIPGINDGQDNAEKTADFILDDLDNRITGLSLLPYMRLGEEKYRSLGRKYEMDDFTYDKEAFNDRLKQVCDYYISRGIRCSIEDKLGS